MNEQMTEDARVFGKGGAMNKHTKGPWYLSRDTDTRGMPGWRIDSDTISLMAWLPDGLDGDLKDEIGTNAHLIAAAPDMLEVCDLLIKSDYLAGGDVNEHERANGVLMEAIAAAYEAVAKVEK